MNLANLSPEARAHLTWSSALRRLERYAGRWYMQDVLPIAREMVRAGLALGRHLTLDGRLVLAGADPEDHGRMLMDSNVLVCWLEVRAARPRRPLDAAVDAALAEIRPDLLLLYGETADLDPTPATGLYRGTMP